MNTDQLDDLKQFIAASISQSEERIRNEISEGFQSVRQEMSEGFLGVGEAIDEIHKQAEEQSSNTDKRLRKLEQQIA